METKPNFLVIIADDLGFSDIGCYGGEINTPNLDALARDGVRMLNYHTAAACSPTRAMVLTGTDAHLAGLGCLIEHKKRPNGAERWNGKPGYEGFLNNDVATLPEILQDNGYHTMLAGKWHLGLQPEAGPSRRGFAASYACLPGCCNHYGWEPQLEDGSTGMPIGGRPLHTENGKLAPTRPNKTEDPEAFFSSKMYTDKLLQYLDERDPSKPWMGYYAFTAPHWPCQSPKALRDKYIDVYADGPDALRLRRLQRMKELGLIAENVEAHEVVAPGYSEWEDMSPQEQAMSSRCMAAYAGMIEAMDQNIGRVMTYLKQTKQYDNTVILFMSDNGAEGAALEASPVMGAKIMDAIRKYYDNSLENIGAWNSYAWIGPRWAQASTAPSRLMKSFSSEGGILVPCIVKAPQFRPEFRKGGFSRAFTTCMDICPTILDMLDIKLDEASSVNALGQRKVIFRGREVHASRGTSWVPYYIEGKSIDPAAGEACSVHHSSEPIGWELFARSALRQGRWKIVHLPKEYGGAAEPGSDEGWELFDVESDPGETKDLATQNPQKLQELQELWEDYVKTTQVVWGESGKVAIPKEERPDLYEDATELQKNWMMLSPGETPPNRYSSK